jgi:hypothetical protein
MMELPLDLSITLDKVPAGAAPETIATIALSCNALGLNHTDVCDFIHILTAFANHIVAVS